MSIRSSSYRSGIAAVGLALVLGVSACSQADGGSPEPTSMGSSAPTSGPNAALKVETPKNLKAITDACSLLTPDQLNQLQAASTGKPDTTVYGGPSCVWSNDKFSAAVGINANTGTGPEQIYQQGNYSDNFAPTKVAGYPAAFVDEQSSLCRVEVGVAKGQSFTVNYAKYSGDAPAMQDPCGYAEKIAAEVLKNIPDA